MIRLLIQTSPSQQREAIETYFTPDAAFTHPFVRTPAFPGSRHLLHIIYRWYKIMSPRVDFTIHSIGTSASPRRGAARRPAPLRAPRGGTQRLRELLD